MANKNLDREKQNSYYLNVVAKDGGGLKVGLPGQRFELSPIFIYKEIRTLKNKCYDFVNK